MMKKIVLLIVVLQSICRLTDATIIIYPAPKGSELNSDFAVKIRQDGKAWHSVATYLAKVANVVNTRTIIENTSFSYFDLSGTVEVAVTYNNGSINKAVIRPLSFGIIPKITGNTITFCLTGPGNISIEVNGDIFHNLQLFANPIENFKPLPSDTNVIYYGPGIHREGLIRVPSNKTVYISGGAVVQGQILIEHAENVRIFGHGVLTQLPLPDDAEVKDKSTSAKSNSGRNDELTVNFSKNVELNGLIVLPHKYSVFIGQSKDVSISNIKSFSSEGNADGIDIFCSTDISINEVFMRNADDCIAIYGHRWSFYGNTKNVTVQNSTLWADVAHPVLIGTHGDSRNPDTLENMKFININILDQHENQIDYQGCLALNAGDENLIRNICFENIRIDDIRKGQLINMRVMFNHKYNTAPGRGIEDIYFKNISYNGDRANMSIISGYDKSRQIKNITFENLKINGKVISDDMPDKPVWYKTGDMANFFIGEHVDGIRFIK
jgi:hypothetical protein